MFSVVIPLYNKEDAILKTLNSVLNQSYELFEIILVNDGSTDKSVEVVGKVSDPRIKIISQLNKGVSNARNNGILAAKHNLIALIDADDLWDHDFLQEMKSLTDDFPEGSLFGCTWSYLYNEGNTKVSDYGIPVNFRGYINNYFEIGKCNTLFTSSSVVLKKNDFINLGMYDEQLRVGEDLDLWFRFALNKQLVFLNKPLAYYNTVSENRVTLRPKLVENTLLGNLKKYNKYEKSNPEFKSFLDVWRLNQVIDFLNGKRDEVYKVKDVLRQINLSKFAYFWTFILKVPEFLHHPLYKIRSQFVVLKMRLKEVNRVNG